MDLIVQWLWQLSGQDPLALIKGFGSGILIGRVDLISKVDLIGAMGQVNLISLFGVDAGIILLISRVNLICHYV